ncbi:hypothetical protein AMS68_002566 [Peltaster fructicola]|uniref:Transcriptional regulator Ngg1 n=1 Tax=Peltaster fructicola TaxID=286661 RepID=A0A6H0XQZ9_9PEZI|nr:hypothetical protein AMS68_002566 [Peltaster fructicola]
MPSNTKKGGNASKARDRRSVSRHSTPVSALTDTAPSTPLTTTSAAASATPATIPKETPYLHISTAALISTNEPSLDALIETASANVPLSRQGDPPSSRDLHSFQSAVKDTLLVRIATRAQTCERGLRQAAQKRKERAQAETEREAAEHAAKAAKAERAGDEERKAKKLGKKRSRDEMMEDDVAIKAEERREREGVPSAVGAHGLARQDGIAVHEGEFAVTPAWIKANRSQGQNPPPSPPVEPGTAALDPMDTRPSTPSSVSSSDEPPPVAPLYERAFGKDPTTCPDPTIYDIRPIYDGMPHDEKQAILNVAQWPESDLRDLTAGDPPDMDFSNAKPANQVHFSTFQSYLEPFIRPFTEEDVAFLKERGDRVTPYLIPARGNRTYKEVWASEDGMSGIEAPRREELDTNVARGSMEDMNDDVAETDEVSMGPIMNRLLSLTRPQINAQPTNLTNGTDSMNLDMNGDTTMINGIDSSDKTLEAFEALLATGNEELAAAQPQVTRPVTALPPDAPRLTGPQPVDYDTFESRALQELKFIGFVAPVDASGYTTHNDDEVAARLRTLQDELRRVSQKNNVRKALVLELTEERMAMQEYSNIADDLDNQVNAAYLKRNRSMAKPSHKKGQAQAKAGQKGVATGVVGGRGVSEGVRQLMQKRRDWIDMVGPVVGFGRAPIVNDGETIFDPDSLKRLEAAEREAEVEGVDGE